MNKKNRPPHPPHSSQVSDESNKIHKMNAKHTVQSAIARSISHNEIVAVTVEAADIYEVLAEVDSASESLGHSKENDGTYDVYGEDQGGNEFRLRVTVDSTSAVSTGGAK